jgi:hypothetical protein
MAQAYAVNSPRKGLTWIKKNPDHRWPGFFVEAAR